jgi:hypothetical protein
MSKSTPFSVRLPQEDTDFIADLKTEDATTPSDKIRSIIRNARLKHQSARDYASALSEAREELHAVTQNVKSGELTHNQHSELVGVFLDWVAEAHAFTVAAPCEKKGSLDLEQLEAGIADRCFRLLELIARMGVTTKAPCYNKDIINKNFESLEELIHLIDIRIHKEGE